MTGLLRPLVLVVLISSLTQGLAYGRKPPATPNADSVHWAAWDSVIGMVDVVPAARYAFYAYRSLAVPCPEIYLMSDAFFSSIVESIPGSQDAFSDRDPRNVNLYRRLRLGEQKGPSFTWDQRSLDPASVYDSGVGQPILSWLDRRLPSAAVLLRASSPHLTTLEAASLLYTQLRRTGHSDSALFIIADSAGRGYLADAEGLISLQTALPLETSLTAITPVLVFNERVVFYPLLGRDDRASDRPLRDLVGKLAPPVSPPLTLLDRIRLEKLRRAAALPTQISRNWASIAACGAIGMYNPVLQNAWAACASDTGEVGATRERAMVRTTMYWADMLSRPVAQLAVLADAGSFSEIAPRWQARYLQLCGRPATVSGRVVNPGRIEAWGNLWAQELLDIPFDDIIRTRAGTGSSQSLAMSAALDMMRRPYFRLEIDPGDRTTSDQNWIVADTGRWQFNLGDWTRIADTLKVRVTAPLLTLSYSTAGLWAGFSADGIETDADNLTVMSLLTEAARVLPSATLRFLAAKNYSTSLSELMIRLETNGIPLRPLPWPKLGPSDDPPR